MKAIVSKQPGPPDTLVLEEVDEPVPGPGEVLIKVDSAALNFFDTLIIEDKYQYKPDRPFSPGAEFAGTVEALGDGVSGFEAGQRVMAYSGWNACREKMVVAAEKVIGLPDAISFEAAAGLTVTYGTTIHGLRDRADLQPGETLAVLGAAGGVGQAAVEIGKAMGARVIACASSEEKLAFCRELGADDTLNYSEVSLKDALKEMTGGQGADVVYDPVGADLAEQAVRATAWNGRFLVIGFAAGTIPKIPLNLVLLKGCALVGVFWGSFAQRTPEAHRSNMEMILNWVAEGKIRPHIDKTYSLADTPVALKALAERKVMGKVIIKP
ncbi:MAG: NADPH:quinone oxidoreductase family protein [Pseudomonadota bacterium]